MFLNATKLIWCQVDNSTKIKILDEKSMDESGSSSNEDEVEEEPRLKYKRLGRVLILNLPAFLLCFLFAKTEEISCFV